MPTKLSRFCEGIMEAAWLAAVLVVPVFFNVYSTRVFEPDKIAVLRTLALACLAAWGIKAVEEGGLRRPEPGQLRAWFSQPLTLPVVALAGVTLLATLLSVTPAVSFWGSYQRLQGAYTTFSYLALFAALAANLRRRAQLERLLSAAILASLPISLYGILQRYGVDPVPWGGNVTRRIAANMGNSIFVAAYLVMVFPPTIVRALNAFRAFFRGGDGSWVKVLLGCCYVFIAAAQVVALLFSGSRGPLLGLLAGSFFLFLVISLLWRKRWLTLGLVGTACAVAAFLIAFNLPGGALENLRQVPGIGRLGQLLDAESRTGRVRTLIWQGAVELVSPHPPLEFPDGRQDALNVLRPLVGYGPESMFVAYNPFFPPELTQVEKRNATPDRAHNETWDVLITTGALGLVTYLALFTTIFYFGLKWLGLVRTRRQRNLFLSLVLGSGAISAAGFVIWQGASYFGVGLPSGMIAGLIAYLMIEAVFGRAESQNQASERFDEDEASQAVERGRKLLLAGLLAGILTHFVEISFGIAIVATRTYFWVYTALLLVAGYRWAGQGAWNQGHWEDSLQEQSGLPKRAAAESASRRPGGKKKKRSLERGGERGSRRAWPEVWGETLIGAATVSLLLIVLGYIYISSASEGDTAIEWFWNSLTRLPTAGSRSSYGILAMLVGVWFLSSLVLAAEGSQSRGGIAWEKSLAAILSTSGLTGVVYGLWQASSLAALGRMQIVGLEDILARTAGLERLFSSFFLIILLLVLILAGLLAVPYLRKNDPLFKGTPLLPLLALAAFLWLAAVTNLSIIQADIAHKQGGLYENQGAIPAAAQIYRRAASLAPNEDQYLLYLGRAYLEQAKTETDPARQEALMLESQAELEKAQAINPLNTDHTANLARLYTSWATFKEDPQNRETFAQISSEYYARATTLSPTNARLWDEWASIYLALTPDLDEAHERLSRALALDPRYDWTYGLFGEYYVLLSESASGEQEEAQALVQAAENYAEALRLSENGDPRLRFSYAVALAGTYVRLEQPGSAIQAYEEALAINPQAAERWQIEEALSQLYAQLEEKEPAVEHATYALSLAPEDQRARLQDWITELQGQP